MRERKITIKDVAREVGVGIGTVSRVLSGHPNVSQRTRERVLEAVARLDFTPNRLARDFARGRTQTIGVMVPSLSIYYFLEILRGVEQSVSENDYSLIIYNADRPGRALEHLNFLAKNRRVDGLVVIALAGESEWPQQFPLPVVSVDAEVPAVVTLSLDHEEGMYLATRHLIDLGHRRVAFVDRPQDPSSGAMTESRRRGYDRACAENSLIIPDTYARVADFSWQGGHEVTKELLTLPDRPTAIAFSSDMQALGAMRAVRELDLTVGEDVAITGYHGVEVAEIAGLSTVSVSAYDMGKTATDVLIRLLSGEPPAADHILFRPQLIARRTSDAERKTPLV